jgi:hypothetical protein
MATCFGARKGARLKLSSLANLRILGYKIILRGVSMTENQGSKDIPPMFNDERTVEWMDEHLTELKQTVSGQRLLSTSLIIGFVVGLAAHIGGYALLLSAPGGFLGLLADLLHALGWSLWTGVVVVVFTEIFPEMKRRQIQQVVDAYESLKRERSKAREKSG